MLEQGLPFLLTILAYYLICIKAQKSLQAGRFGNYFDGCGCFPQSWDTANSSPNFPRVELVCFYVVFIFMRNVVFVLLQNIQNCPLGFPIHRAESMYLWQFYMCPTIPLGSGGGGMCYTDVYHKWLYGHESSSTLKFY